jgi:hypothetical protein
MQEFKINQRELIIPPPPPPPPLAIYKIGPKKFVTKENKGTTSKHPNLVRDYKNYHLQKSSEC